MKRRLSCLGVRHPDGVPYLDGLRGVFIAAALGGITVTIDARATTGSGGGDDRRTADQAAECRRASTMTLKAGRFCRRLG